MTFADKMDAFIAEFTKEHTLSGVIRVTLKDEIIYDRKVGMADYEKNIPFTDNSMFTIYSFSKPFCAIGLMKLYDKGLVKLDAHPGKYVPEAREFDERVKISQLLNHTSGLPDFEQDKKFSKEYTHGYAHELRDQLRIIASAPTTYPQRFVPGTDNFYSNINFIICALIIENITGQKYADYMKSEVFEPLGMKTAFVDDIDVQCENRVCGHEMIDGKIIPCKSTLHWLLGAGDIVASVDDLYCINKAIKNRTLLSDDAWTKVLTPSPINNMGLGCAVYEWHGKNIIRHNGAHKGFMSMHVQIPSDDLDFLFLTNYGFNCCRNDLADAVHNAFYGNESVQKLGEMDKGYGGK